MGIVREGRGKRVRREEQEAKMFHQKTFQIVTDHIRLKTVYSHLLLHSPHPHRRTFLW